MRLASIGFWTALGAMPLVALAQGNEVCSHDTLTIDGSPVTVSLCIPESGASKKSDGAAMSVPVRETFVSGERHTTRTVSLEFTARKAASRALDDASLQELGISKTLHLTIAYEAGEIRLDHALLIPGAVSLK